jgi:hypothetical protein
VAIASNTENPGQIVIPDSAMAVALTREIKHTCTSPGITIVYPPLFGKGSSSDFASADIQIEIQKLDDIRRAAHSAVDKANIYYLRDNPQTTEATKTPTPITDSNGRPIRDSANNPITHDVTVTTIKGSTAVTGDPVLTAALTDINGLYDSFMNSLLQVNSGTGVIGSSSVIQGYQLATLLKGVKDAPPTLGGPAAPAAAPPAAPAAAPPDYSAWYRSPAFVLLATVANAGGTEHVHKNIWTALWSGDKITYSGGAVVVTSLWRPGSGSSTSPVYSDVLRYRAPFSKIQDPGCMEGVDSGDDLAKKEPNPKKKTPCAMISR